MNLASHHTQNVGGWGMGDFGQESVILCEILYIGVLKLRIMW